MRLLLLALLFIGYVTFTWQPVSTQTDVKIAIQGQDVIVTWNQISNANKACIGKITATQHYVAIGCINSKQGHNSFSTIGFGDGMHKHYDGDTYIIEEYNNDTYYGRSKAYEARHYYYMSLFSQPAVVYLPIINKD